MHSRAERIKTLYCSFSVTLEGGGNLEEGIGYKIKEIQGKRETTGEKPPVVKNTSSTTNDTHSTSEKESLAK